MRAVSVQPLNLMRKIKVLRVVTRLNIGGIAPQMILLTSRLNGDRFKSILVKGKEGKDEGDMNELLEKERVTPVYIDQLRREISVGKDFIAFWKLLRLIRRERPDIVHTHTAKAGTLGRLAARVAGVPIIVHTFHGNVFEGYFGRLKSKLFLTIERGLARISQGIIAVSYSQRGELLRLGLGNARTIFFTPECLELAPFLTSGENRGTFRRELGLDDKVPLIGTIGRLVPIKGHTYFLQAARLVGQDFPEARFIVVGDGELREELKRLTVELGISDRVIFCGFRKDLSRIYADLDIVVLSSLNEGLPLSIIEALTSQKPVVATDVGGVQDLIEPGVTGILVPKQDPLSLSQGIEFILRNPDQGKEFGENGRKKVFPSLDYTRLISDMEKLYVSLIEKRYWKMKLGQNSGRQEMGCL